MQDMINWIMIGVCLAIGFYLMPLIVTVIITIFVGIYVVLNEILKSILDLFRSKE